MATVPVLKVEIAFGDTPLDTTQTWTDVSAYVRQSPGVSIRRGRMSESAVFEAGSAQLTLNNRDRRFDPSHATGPYFGQLLPRTQIRITATWSAVDYVMFQGHITGWPQSLAPPAGLDATVTIEAVDGLAWLANNRVPNDLVYTYAATTIGSLALFLRQADTERWTDATGNGYTALLATGTGRTASSIAAGSASTAVQFDRATTWSLSTPWPGAGSTNPWSISFWIQTSDIGTDPNFAMSGSSSSDIERTGAGRLLAESGSWSVWTSPGILNDGAPHHCCITSDGTNRSSITLYVDGTARTLEASNGTGAGFVLDTIGGSGGNYCNGTLQDVAVFNKQLSAAEVLAFYNYSRGYVEETSSTRVTRILDDVGWPASWRDIAVSTSTTLGHTRATVGQLVYNARTAIDLLQEVERTEQGRLFCSKDNKLIFLGRYYHQEVTAGSTSQQIFSDDGGATAVPYSTFGFRYDDLDVTNDATVTTPTTWAKASDSTSITAHGLQSDKIDTILTNWTDADSMARGLVARGKDPTWRVTPIMAFPANNTARWDEVLGLELVQRVTIENTPMGVGAQNAQDVSIDYLEWLIEAGNWALTIAGSPTKDVWFVIGTSTIGGTDVIGF